ncbi:MAG TPA: NFACT RNA binding domain-containing protein [Clostridia bacterium]|nr:NFACT RNA binding domain-containing protein [Clostridia bacterium]
MDGLCLHAAALEIERALSGGRIDKIQQTEKDELILSVRGGRANYRLLLNVSAADARVHLSDNKKQSPADAPMFCMLLRKRITGGRLVSFEQANMDRVLAIGIEASSELGDPARFTLYCELMGKHSNIILADGNGVVVDAIKRVGPAMSGVRPILPGLTYSLPPAQDKLDPRAAPEGAFINAASGAQNPAKALSQKFFGLSARTAEALLASFGAGGLRRFFGEISQKAEAYLLLDEDGAPRDVLPFRAANENCERTEGIGAAYDALYAERERTEWIKRHGASARKVIQNNIERCEKKLELYADALNAGESIEQNRLFGELLTANLHQLKAGPDAAAVLNYYLDPPAETLIPMDAHLTPGENAQRYYRKYQKLKAARDMALVQREQTLAELDYLEGQMENLRNCTAQNELEELLDELRAQGYIKKDRGERRKQKLPASKPMRFVSSDGIEVLVGKNNAQNDALTLKTALPNETWLHAKNMPGSHVIVRREGEVPERTLREAAALAAYYSKARGGENVPVDYTPRKYVKKPSGAKPGMVIYTTNRTVYATPDETLIKRLRAEPRA